MSKNKYTLDEDFQAIYIPKEPHLPNNSSTKPLLQTYPPLGQVTVVHNGDINIKAVLEIPSSESNDLWEVALWYSEDNAQWEEIKLRPVDPEQEPQELQNLQPSVARCYYSASLSFLVSLKFTLKFRHDPNADWIWIRDHSGFADGIIIWQANEITDEIEELVKQWESRWTVTSITSQSPKSRLWSLKADVPCSKDDHSGTRDIQIFNHPAGALR